MAQDTIDQLTRSPPPSSADSVFRQITDRLATAIIAGHNAAGDLVPAADSLLDDATVSRTAYREALKYLSAKGLIEARPKSGTRVAPRSAWNMLDPDILRWSLASKPDENFITELFELRRIIEPQAARLASLWRSEEDLARIEHALTGMKTAPAYTEANMRFDLAFHEAIFDAAGNAPLNCLKTVISTTLVWGMRLQRGSDPAFFTVALADHARVFEAIRDRDADQAAAMTTVLVTIARTDVLRAFRLRRGESAGAALAVEAE